MAAADDDFNDDWGDEDSFNDGGGFSDDGAVDPGDGFGATPATEAKSEFQVLELPEIESAVAHALENFSETTGVPKDVACILLRLNKWNKEDLVTQFFDKQDKVLKDAGLDNYDKPPSPAATPFTCPICYDSFEAKDIFALSCSHHFCRTCWGAYIEDKIKQGKIALRITCPMSKCPKFVLDGMVKQLIPRKSFEAYQLQISKSYVEDNRRLRWCPAPRCERAIQAYNATTVKCKCGNSFCFQCNEEAHAPSTCTQLSLWLDKCRNESETAHWIIANTKKCPKCFIRIEKNSGCNHMVCRSCKAEFCWVCMGDWTEHGNKTGGFYKCNRYDPRAKKSDELTGTEEAKAELNRYLHYYQRYHNHDQSRKFAGEQALKVEERMRELQAQGGADSTWIDVQYLKNASDMVIECRQVLKFTYVFAYYLKAGPEKELFEYLQQELEQNTEMLSELSETPLNEIDRSSVVNYTRVTEQFMKNLLEGVEKGLTQ